MRTKWEVLEARAADLQAQLEDAEAYLAGLDETDCGLTCGGCGTVLATEGDFARHFVIPDERFLNLGNCPGEDR